MTLTFSVRTWAWGLAAAVAASQAAWVVYLAANRGLVPADIADQLGMHVESGVLVSFIAGIGALIVAHRPRHPVGWIICATSASAIPDALGRMYVVDGLYVHPGALPGVEYVAWFVEWAWFPAIVALLVFLPLYFPDGRLPGPRWRPVAIGFGVWLALATTGYAFSPWEPVDFPGVDRVLQLEPAVALGALMVASPLAVGVSFASVVVRRRRATGIEREQLRWFLYACAVAVTGWTVMIVVGTLTPEGWGWFGVVLTHGPIALIMASVAIAILRYRLYDIDLLINRTLVYGGLTGSALLAYTLVVVTVSRLTTSEMEWRGSVIVVALVAIAAYPLREWLQKSVNRFMYGDRDDPARAMSRLNRRVSDSLSPAGLLPAIAETIGHALRLPYVAIELSGTAAPVTFGAIGSPAERFDLVHQGESVGTLLVGRRADNEHFTPADVRVLEELARQVASAAHAVRLSEDLQRSRERLVLAREEERLRLRRDLHDGVGSALAGLALQAGNARQRLPDDPEEALRWVSGLEEGIRAAVIDVRRIVDDLRPPSLDELGLAAALRERADALLPGVVTVSVATGTGRLPAAVEVAAYRIATEAMTNVARHAAARAVTLEAHTEEQSLVIEVVDDGRGLPRTPTPGVGLRSMHERADELGGSCHITSGSGGGTTVRAVLPLTDEETHGG